MEQRFHILAGPDCNNNCVFCMEDDREDRRRRLALITPARVLELLRGHVAEGEVMFTEGGVFTAGAVTVMLTVAVPFRPTPSETSSVMAWLPAASTCQNILCVPRAPLMLELQA